MRTSFAVLMCILFISSNCLSTPFVEYQKNAVSIENSLIDVSISEAKVKKMSALVLVSASYGRPGIESFNRGIIDTWSSLGLSTDSLSVHYLDMNRGDKLEITSSLKTYILQREAHKKYDLVVLLQQDAVDFFLEELNDRVAIGAPLLIAFSKISEKELFKYGRKAVTPKNSLEFNETLEAALKIFPKTKNVFIVSGNSDSDLSPVEDFLKEDSLKWKNKVKISHNTSLDFSQMKRVLANLPTDTIVIRGSYGTDVSKKNLGKTPVELGIELSNSTIAPTFVLYETAIGNAPVIGGQVQKISDVAKTLIHEGIRIAANPSSRGTLTQLPMPAAAIYDYSDIIRHHGDISAIPQGAEILNRPSSIWDDYRKEVLVSVTALLILILMISVLLIERKGRRAFAAQLQVSKKQLQNILDLTPHVAIQRYSDDGRIVDWNAASTSMYGWNKKEVFGKLVREFLGDSDASRILEDSISKAKSGNGSPQCRKTVIGKDGNPREILTTLFSIPNDDGGQSYVSMDVDVSELKRHEDSLSQLASVFAHSSEGILITGLDGRVVSVNDSLCRITGFERCDIENHYYARFLRVIASNVNEIEEGIKSSLLRYGGWRSEITGVKKDGSQFFALMNINAALDIDGVAKHYVCLLSEITELKRKQFALERLAHYDRLTDLPNRVLFSQRLLSSMEKVPKSGSQLAVLYIDLDGFKQVNDQNGHGVGDQLLVEISKRMTQVLRRTDTIARLGGDEFAAVLPDILPSDSITQVLEHLIDVVSKPVLLNSRELKVTASIGVSFYQDGHMDADQLLRQADQAMYIAKQSGKNRYKVFDSEQERTIQARNDDLARLQIALLNNEFELFYQPKVNVSKGRMDGVEALIRWRHPERGVLSPAHFLPLLENTPLSISVGDWVIAEALRQAQYWNDIGLRIPISVNVDGSQLAQDDFIEKLASTVSAHPNLPLHTLELEILESSALDRVADIGTVIRRCSSMGINTSLDDFGTGYSTLSYLKELPVQTLKIDQSFIRNIVHDENKGDLAIVQAILGLAHGFGRAVVVEGVETMEHVQVLSALGCDYMQGYAFAKPMPAINIPDWMKMWELSQRKDA